jgi:hypothetical protein
MKMRPTLVTLIFERETTKNARLVSKFRQIEEFPVWS